VESRAQAGWPEELDHDVAAFVLVSYPREIGQRFGATPVLDLVANSIPVLGRLFFLNRDASTGRVIDFPTSQPADILDWLEDNKMGSSVVALAYRKKSMLVIRSQGVSGIAKQDRIRQTVPNATVTDLLEALVHFHRDKTLIPSVCPIGVWEKGRAAQYIPGADPEKAIQLALRDALSFWFRGIVRAEIEDSTNIGRIDIDRKSVV
jgi:hypothetical protein